MSDRDLVGFSNRRDYPALKRDASRKSQLRGEFRGFP
jgi:hypothetical protein